MIKVNEVREKLVDGKLTKYAEHEMEITFERFKESFCNERWEGETRHDYRDTKYGRYHTTLIVTNPYTHARTTRTFEFD